MSVNSPFPLLFIPGVGVYLCYWTHVVPGIVLPYTCFCVPIICLYIYSFLFSLYNLRLLLCYWALTSLCGQSVLVLFSCLFSFLNKALVLHVVFCFILARPFAVSDLISYLHPMGR